jgi:hypothetical protein
MEPNPSVFSDLQLDSSALDVVWDDLGGDERHLLDGIGQPILQVLNNRVLSVRRVNPKHENRRDYESTFDLI